MKLEEFFKEAKKDYLSIKPPERVSLYGWLELRDKLDKKVLLHDFVLWVLLRPAFATALVILLLVGFAGAVAAASKNSLPGETLYPVKRVYEDIAAVVTGDNQIKLDARAHEIIILSQKEEEDSQRLKESVIEYKISVARFKEKVNEKERVELKEKLKRHKEEFERIYNKSKSKEEIKKAIEATEINGEEVKGEKEEDHEEED